MINKNICDFCKSTSSPTFWDFKDGTILCDSCHTKIGIQWDEEKIPSTKTKWFNNHLYERTDRFNRLISKKWLKIQAGVIILFLAYSYFFLDFLTILFALPFFIGLVIYYVFVSDRVATTENRNLQCDYCKEGKSSEFVIYRFGAGKICVDCYKKVGSLWDDYAITEKNTHTYIHFLGALGGLFSAFITAKKQVNNKVRLAKIKALIERTKLEN